MVCHRRATGPRASKTSRGVVGFEAGCSVLTCRWSLSQIMHRLGSRPDGLTTVGSERALTALRKPLNAPDVLKLGVGPMSGAKHTGDTVADILSGTAACQPGKTAPRALDWSLSLAYWLARPEEQ